MQFSINKVTLVGNLARDPELRYTQGGTAVCSFSLATNRPIKNGNGDWESVATFHNIVCWKKLAENAAENYQKGDKVFVEGRIENRSYTDKQGNKKYRSEVIADSVIGFGDRTVRNVKEELGAETQPKETPTDDGQEPPESYESEDQGVANDIPF